MKKIESASLPKIIAKCGYNRNIPLEVCGCPKELGAAGFSPFISTIGATRIQHFLKNWRTPEEDIGKALRIAMAWTQYSAGVLYPIFSNTTTDLSYIKGRTVLETRSFLNKVNGIIHLVNTYVQFLARRHDVLIMDSVNTQMIRKVTTNQKEKINCVRMYLGVQFTSEICTIHGDSFIPGLLEGARYRLNYKPPSQSPTM